MFSSTPDSTTAFNFKKIELPHDILEYRISTGNSLDLETQNDNKKITINMPTSFDDFEDTFSNVSDM
jgi:D-alanyl-D-alanine dipeptidase